MIKKLLHIFAGLLFLLPSYAQQQVDSLRNIQLNDVTIVGKNGLETKNGSKPLSSVDDYLGQQNNVSLIKRGGYAWEPTLNTMATERISVTIDGMKIFCACTDRMDPITSYVEIVNLSNIHISSGISGSPYSSNAIGGGIDMNLYKAGFHEKSFKQNLYSGYETNGNYKILGIGLAYSSPRVYSNSTLFYRKSGNYDAGQGKEVRFSQFEKINLMNSTGFRISNNNTIEGTVIYDLASNVGYPALTMDVKSAKGFISSLSYTRDNLSGILSKWETKIYYNSIDHVMDDTKRPDVVMHMDMPGGSKTAGFYSLLPISVNHHNFQVNLDAYYNQSTAEMTMYPSDPGQKTMFMYTWPDIRTFNAGLHLEDKYCIDSNQAIQLVSKLSLQKDGVERLFGFNSMRIYYPEMQQFQSRVLGNISAKYMYYTELLRLKLGGGYGTRAPSATEAYGYYLYNSFDNFDYLGNPLLKSESAWQGDISLCLSFNKSKINLESSYFYFNNYIIGKNDPAFSSMTIQASGVKVYRNLPNAQIFNLGAEWTQAFLSYFTWSNKVSYAYGIDQAKNPLPLIAPLLYTSNLSLRKKSFFADCVLQGASKQYRYSSEFGEDQTPAYSVFGCSVGYNFKMKNESLSFKIGVENLLDRNYSTFSDWNNIPRKGRNLFVNISLNI